MFKNKLAGMRKAVAGAAAASLVATGMFAVAAVPAQAATADVDGATLSWGIKSSFLDYVNGLIGNGSISTSGNASGEGPFTWAAGSGTVEDSDAGSADVSFSGSVEFSAHEGALDVALSNPRIEINGASGELYLDAQSKALDGEEFAQSNVRFATFTTGNPSVGTDSIEIAATNVLLTQAGTLAFAGFYKENDELDNFTLTLPYTAPVIDTSVSLEVTPTSIEVDDEVSLSATVSPADAPGEVIFRTGSSAIATVDVSNGSAVAAPAITQEAGEQQITAEFVPADATAYNSSTSAAVSLTVTPAEETSDPADPVAASIQVFLADGTPYSNQKLVEGDELIIRGAGFLPNPPATSGARPPLAGQFTGAYAAIGSFADDWKPSAGAASANRVTFDTKWAVHEAQLTVIGGAARGGIALAEDGTFETRLVVPAADADGVLADGNWGVYTYAGGGATYAPFETRTDLNVDLAQDESDPSEASIEVLLADGTTKYSNQPLEEGDQLVVKGYGFDPSANVGGMGTPIPADLPQGTFIVFGSFAQTWKPSEGAPSSSRQSDGDARVWALTEATLNEIPERFREGIQSQWVELAADGSFTATVNLVEPLNPVENGNWGIYTYPGGVDLEPNPAQEHEQILNYTATGEQPEDPESNPQVTVTPNTDIDPATENTFTVSSTGFTGPAAANGVYVQLGETSIFDGNGPLPADGWVTQAWVMPSQISDGEWSVDLTVPAGELDPAKEYEVVTSAAHGLSITNRTLDTFTPISLQVEDESPEVPGLSVTVSPVTGIDPAVENTFTVSGSGFDNPAAASGVYVLLGETSVFDGEGPLPSDGWVNLTWVMPSQISDGEWSVDLTVPAGELDPAKEYEVVTSAAHGLSVTDRSLDTFTSITLKIEDETPVEPEKPEPTISVDKQSLKQGEKLTIKGTGFAPGELVAAEVHSPVADLGTQKANVQGEVTFTWTVPSDFSAGNHTVWLKSPSGEVSEQIAVTAIQVDPVCDARAVDTGSVTWGLKESFRTYVTDGAAKGAITVAGGATKDSENIVTWNGANGVVNEDLTGSASFEGSVNFTGHHGVLNLTFANPQIQLTSTTSANVVFDVNGTDMSGKAIGSKGLVIATASFPAIKAGNTIVVNNANTVLTTTGQEAFIGFYEPGDVLDSISFSLTLGAETECVDTPEPGENNGPSKPAPTLPKPEPKPVPTPPVVEDPEDSQPAGPTCVANAVSGAMLNWGVKSSFRSYIQGPIAQGTISTSGVTSNGGGFTWSGGTGAFNTDAHKGTVRFGGTVSFSGHGGQLDMVISNPRIQINSANRATLIVDVRSKALDGSSMNQNGVAFASLSLPRATQNGSTLNYNGASATLTAAGAQAFSGFYDAGSALDPVSFSLPLGGEVECDASTGTLSETGASVDGLGLMLGLMLLGGGLIVARNRRVRA